MGLAGIFIIMPGLDGGDAVSEVLSTILMVGGRDPACGDRGVAGLRDMAADGVVDNDGDGDPVGGERNVHGSRRDGR